MQARARTSKPKQPALPHSLPRMPKAPKPAISVTHLPLTSCAAKTAQEAIALKQLQAEKEFGAINWDIDKEKSSVIDGSQVTKYEYSFEKEIDHVTKKYEYKTIYVFNSSMCYEISVYGNAASVDDVVNSIEF